ncbi:TrkH family potassium uptake protein [Candidatus Contubernalis alkaliaceticus]|uniref:TrkH family potassium uptake protein n=1 Tax=Candidatus Contubernalis alkaliaceticus TaxID=338645 RepID=UPI001F4C4BBD|nr:TrkH family potassium uptake protein [Candidatus Contubernalis alkalaceticus]UNC92253.1 TrkH family potassium uptake protein [Candidatus Contubernalis alkalaceticus]
MRHRLLLRERYLTIFKYVGVIVTAVGIFLLVPLFFLISYSQELPYAASFLWASSLALITGGTLYFFSTGKIKNEPALTIAEGGVIVVMAWFLTILFSTLPFIISGLCSPLHALFETVSGWTTTGLSVMNVEETPALFLFWRSFMQFLGGAGLAVIMLSAIIGPHGLGLYQAEGRTELLLPQIRRSAKLILTIYFGYTLTGLVLYLTAGMSFFDALNHSMAALSTGGFSTKTNSIGEWNSLTVEMVTMVLMLLGTINFATHYLLLRGRIKDFFRSGEIQLVIVLTSLAVPAVAFLGLRQIYFGLGQTFRISLFQTISALSTTGFSTVSFNNWNMFGILVVILLMLVGGGVNSTAGGIKQYRIYVMFKSLTWEFKKYFLPRSAVIQNYVWKGESKDYLSPQQINQVSNFIYLFVITYFLGVLIFVASGYPLGDSMFELASSLGTVGLSVGIVSSQAPPHILWTVIFGMTLGRLEFIIIFVSLFKLGRDFKNYIIK